MATITTIIIKWFYSKSGLHSLEAALCVPEKNISSIYTAVTNLRITKIYMINQNGYSVGEMDLSSI